jgi:phage repressor protein C with HTH and peptisase S24 domain
MTMSERLQQALDARGRNAASLVSELKTSKGLVYNILSGKTNPDNVRASTLDAICTALAIAPVWLLTGKGPMAQAAATPAPAASIREDRSGYLRPISAWDTPADLPADAFAFLPHLDAYMSAGNGGPSADAIEVTDKATPFRSDYLRRKGWNPSTHFTMRCKGDSMEPTIQDGAPVVIDTSEDGRRIRSGRIYAIAFDGERLLKRLDRLPGGTLRIRSDNSAPLYAAFEVPEASIEVIGRAVWTPSEL